MNSPQKSRWISSSSQMAQRLAPVVSVLVAAVLCMAGRVDAAAPDLTAGGVPNDGDQWNLGPTGMAGWCYREGISTANARQFLVRSVATGSPAAGIMAVNDVILGASGTGADPVSFTEDARVAFAQAITDAEERNPATLKILRWRAGVTSIESLTLETLGAYSATAPYNCPKSAAILEKGIQWMMNTNANDGNWRYSALTLLAANDNANPNNTARQAKAASDVRQLILTPELIATYTSGKSIFDGNVAKPWHIGPKLIALSEYYLKTGDPDPNVMASIRAYAHCIANGQSLFGTCGHYFTNPGFRNTPVNGPYNVGYGPVNAAAIPCYIGLVLANKCGLTDPEIMAGIERAGTFYAQYTHLGCAGYGEHLPYEGHDTNGKAGMQALAFQLEGDRPESAKYYAKSSAAAAIAERDIGHTGSFFAFLYAPLGANVGGPDAMAYYFRETRWMYELARRWDGSFVYNSFSSGGVEVDALYGQGNCLMATPMLLTYAMPLRQTYLTGKDQNTANWITPAEMPEVSAASAHIYDATSRTTPELVSDLSSWSPKVRRYAGREIKLRTADHATVLPTLHAMAANESATIYARAGACLAMGEIGNSSSVPVLLPLVTHPNYVVRFSASLAIRYMPAAANIPHVNALMQACITNAKPLLPLDAQDPMQTVNGNLCSALFAPWAALFQHDLVGVDRNLLYGAMRVCAANAQAEVRNGLHNIYPKLTQTDIDQLGDLFVNIAYENAPAGMGTPLAREPAMSFLQSKGRAEGVPLAIRLAEDFGYESGNISSAINVLADYAGSSNTVTPNPDVEHFCDVLIASGAKYGIPEAQAALAAIAADSSPEILTPFKSIDWIIPDHAAFNLPKKSTVLRVHSKNRSNPDSTYTWRKLRGAGAVSFSPNGTSAAKDATVVFDGIPGEYLFEVTMSDSHGLTEVSKTVAVTLRNSGGTLPPNSPPTANNQLLTTTQGAPTQVILTGADPEGYPLNYTVTGSPANGSLSGTAPHLVYTPVANYTGADNISFKVEDSEGQVATATVSITVNATAPVGLAIYEPFNYAAGNLHAKSGASEIGLTGTWTTGSQITTESPSLTYGTLPASGNRVRSVGMNSPGGSRPINPSALAGRGLLDNGATLWFSVVMGGYGGWDASGNVFHLALGNNGITYTFPNSYNIPNDGGIPGSGIGVRLWNKGVYATQFAATGEQLTGAYDNTVTGGIVNDNPRLVVGKITWGAASDTIEIYLPETDMVLPLPTSVLSANVDQSTFDTLTFSRGANVLLDEIRFGATLQSVLQGTVAMSADVTAPTPDPMTFAVAPAPANSSSITMIATPAFDGMGVEYYFTCTAGGGNDSGWQTSNVYTDSGLTPGVVYSYTVKARDQHPALNETTASAAASATIPALGTVPGVEGLPESLAQSLITNAALTVGTVTQSGAYSMTVPAGHVLSQSPSDGASVAYGSAVNLVISIGQNPVLPVLTPVNIVDNKNGEQVELGTPITFTLTFSKDINSATLDAGDFINVGDAPVTIGTFTETSPGVVTVSVTPSGTVSGILRFAVAAGAVIEDTLGNDLNTTSAIIDDTVISIVPIQPKTQTFTGNNSASSDNWNNSLNWNINTGPIPTGTDNVIIPSNKQVSSNSTATPIFEGNLTIGSGATLQAGYSVSDIKVFNCLGTPGKTTIAIGGGSQLFFRGNFSPVMPAIALQGNAEITMGASTSAGTDPVFNYPVTGPYTLTLSGKSDAIANFNVANNFGHLRLSTQYGSLFTVNANVAGSLGGDVTVMADYTTGGKGANLVFATANAMSDTATLALYGNTGSLVTLNANDTIGGLKLNGVKQLPGFYNSGNSNWVSGTGTLTVNGASIAYWNPTGGPSGTWDESNIWNDQANLSGTDNAWTPGQIAAFNAAGTYGVTLSGTKEIGGLMLTNGTLTLANGGLSLSSDAPFNVASGATLAVNTVIEQNSLGLGLHKSGAGMLNLLGENTFTGPVAIGAGTLSIATIDNAGAPSALGQYPDSGIGGLILAGGTLRYTGGSTTVNRGFTFAGSSSIDVNNAGSSLTLANVETAGPGALTATGGAGSNLGLGNIKIVQSNNITLNPTTASMSVASVEGYSAYPLNATITLAGSASGNVITGNIYASVYPGSAYQQGTAVVKNGTGDWRIAGAMTAGPVANSNLTVNEGTLIMAGSNTYTGYTNLNNNSKLVLDFAATNTSKIGGALYLNGGTLELKGGSHIEVVGATTLNAGPTSFITRNGGTARLRMNALNRSAQSSIFFLDGTVADTDRTNTNGILGGYATVGADWAVNSTNGADGTVTALSSYDPWTNNGGSSTANYLLTSGDALGGALAANSLKISNIGLNESLNLGANNLSITSTGATTLGGVLYTGGAFGKYTINGSGSLLASSTTGELVVNTHDGTLIVNAPVVTSGATAGLLTKSGNGSLVLGGNSLYTGTTRVTSGKLFVNGSLSNVSAALTVDPGATLGGSGTVGRNVSIADGGKLEFNLSTSAASHDRLDISSGRSFAFSGSSVLTITASAGAAPGLYTLVTGGNNITGSAPATVILPPGWTADPPVISTNQLRINITNVVAPPNALPLWSGNPLNQGNTNEGVPYSASIAANAYDSNNDPLTFAKVSGPAWLNVAANGTLSGTPTNSDVGANSFTLSVSDGIGVPVEATLNITVTNVNDAPVWASNPLIGPNATEDVAYSQNMATAASDVDAGAVLTFAKVSGPSWLNVAANGIISGNPSNAEVGLNVCTISVSDGIAAPVETTLEITVTNTNDAPVWTSTPVVGGNAIEDSAYSGSLSGSVLDVDAGASLSFTKISGPAWLNVASNGSLSGLPVNANVGINSFTVSVTDGIATAVNATLNIIVINTNDAPVAVAQSVSTERETALPITLEGTDMDGDTLTYTIVSQPTHGTLSGTAPNLTYTPAASYIGSDSLTFKVNDGTVDSTVATVSIAVTRTNETPVSVAQSVTTDEDAALPITLTGTDADSDPLSYSIVTQPVNGTLSGTAPNVTYTPSANYNGSDSFTFKVNDSLEDSPVATVSITVTPVNDVPVFTVNPIILAGGVENMAYSGETLAGSAIDVESGALTYSKVSGPSWLVVATNGALSGTPPNGSAGSNSFVVRVTDGASATADATVEIAIAFGDRIWADSYITSLSVTAPTTVVSSLNFPSFLAGPLTGASSLTLSGYVGGQSSFINNAGNTFDGNIIVNSGTLRIAGSPFVSNGGFTASGMTSSDTITLNRAGTMTIDDNVTGGYTANRFGTAGNRPAVNLAGGTINLNGLNNASSSVQTLGALTAISGYSTINVTRNSNGNPTLTFGNLAINKGSAINLYSAALGTGTNDARITFNSVPNMSNGIIAGAKVWNGGAGTGDFATYGANGVTPFTAYDVFAANDINGATSTQNARMTGAFTPAALAADTTVNALNINGNGGTWNMTNKLTVASGMILRNGTNAAIDISSGTLTAGTGSPIDLHIFTAQQNMSMSGTAVIADNGPGGVVTLVKSHGNQLSLNNGVNNTYSGGTYVVDGQLNTGNVANRRYLGSGKATVNNAILTLGAIGATSNGTGDDYSAVNGGQINIANAAYTSSDTFNIAANSVISGQTTGLNSLDRGIGAGTSNITLAADSVISHGTVLTGPLNPNTGTIKNLGMSADLYYGLTNDQNNAAGQITIGTGTAFKGISSERVAKTWSVGTINVSSGTTDVYFRGLSTPSAAPTLVVIGNGTTAGSGAIVSLAGAGAVNINVLGNVQVTDTDAVFGDTSTGRNVKFVVTAGSSLMIAQATGMGSGNGIASAAVQNGGTLNINNAAALNGAVAVEAGGRLVANQAGGLTGGGTLTFSEGSLIDITNATGFSGSQASSASVAAGTIVRLYNSAQPGTASATLDSLLGSKSPVYQLNGDIDVPEPASPGTTTLTLNKNGSGVGGILTNGSASAFFRNNVNGQLALGANGGVIAATSNTELQVQENIVGTGVTLTIGTTAIIDGNPKLGSVALGAAIGSNTYTGETIINAGTLRMGYADVLGANTNQLTVNTGGRLLMNNQALTVGNLTGTGGVISGGGTTLTIGQGDNGGGNFQGSIQDTNTKLTKVGTGTITLSGTNTYTGVTTINAGKLLINGNQSSATGNLTVAANATLGGSGTLGGSTTIAAGGKLEFDLSTPAGSHNPLDFAAGKGLTFSGASQLTITTSGGIAPGTYALITGGNNIIGAAPATLNLPIGMTATVSISGNSLVLNVTSAGADTTAPTLVSITDDQGGASIAADTTVNYTVTFSEDMDAATVQPADFGNEGTASGVIDSVTETSPGVFFVSVTPSSAGSLQLRINAGAVLGDSSGNALNTTSSILDDTTITVTPLNSAPVAGSQNVATNEDIALPITLTATDAENNPLTYTVLAVPTNGTLSGTAPNLTYTPAANYNGSDSITFKVNDGLVDSITATVSITVNPVNDVPVAIAQNLGTNEDTALPVILAGIDVENSALAFVIVSPPSNGTLVGTAPNLTYIPAPNFNGADGFTFRVNDGTVDSALATVSITVNALNDVPVAVAQNVTTDEDTALPITLSGTDTESSALTYTIVTPPTNGSISGTAPNVIYTPNSNFNGSDSFSFRVNDGTVDSAAATVSISVNAVNDVPVAVAQNVNTDEDTALPVTLSGTDTENSALTYTVVTGPSNGTLSGTAPNLTFMPTANLNGADSFTFTVNDGSVDSAIATVSITVDAVNDEPVFAANPISATAATEDEAYSASIAGSASDVDAGATLSYAKVSGPAWLTVASNGTLGGTPASGDVGANSFIISVSDGIAVPVQATLDITVENAILTYTVTYSGNGNTEGSAPSDANNPYAAGSTVTVLGNTGILTKTGYTFAGWNTSANGNGTDYAPGASLQIAADTTLYARWNSLPSVDAGQDQVVSLNAAVPWLPVQVSPQAWYDASDAGTITSSGGLVSEWRDKSGNNRHATQPTGTNQPGTGTNTMGGLNVISLNGTSQFLNANLDYLAGVAHSAFIVTKTTAYRNIYGAANANSGASSLHVGFLNATQYRMNYWGNDWNGTIGSSFSASGGNVLNYVWTPGVSKQIFANGTSQGTSGIAGVIGTMAGGGRIGNVVGQGMYGGDIAEIIFITGTVSAADRERMEGYLAHKWGLQQQLPLNHPYQSAAPVAPGVVVNLDGTVSDSDPGDTVDSTWTLESGPVGAVASFADASAADTTLVLDQTGVYTVRLTANDGLGSAHDELTITVNDPPVNVAPVWTSDPVIKGDATEDAAYATTLAGDASDTDNDPLSFAKVGGPAWLTVASSGVLGGTPTNSDVGANSFTVSVSDGINAPVEVTLNITVINTNDVPVFAVDPIVAATATEDEIYSASIAGSVGDEDAGATLSFAKVDGPAWLTVAADGTLGGTPGDGDAGSNSFTVSVSDGIAAVVTATLDITVINTNDAPTWASNPVNGANATEDAAYGGTLVVSASDIDNGAILTFAKVSGPAWLGVANDGTLSGTPSNSDVGANSFTVSVSDGIAAPVQTNFNIAVINTNDAPVFTVDPVVAAGGSESTAYTGVSLAGTAIDIDGGDTITYSKVSGPAWLAVALDGTLSGTPPSGSAGLNSFVVRATDGASATDDATLEITVTGLPLPWVSTDIGTGMLAGSTTHNAGTFTQAGSGVIGGTSDRLSFTYQTLSGDGEIIARISTLQNTGTGSRVGVMIRDTLAPNSKRIFMGMSGTNTYRWARRTATGGSTSTTNSSTGTVPNTWVRLVRSGTTITAYKSTNGTTWTTVGSTTNTTFASTCYIGLAVGSGSTTTLNTSQFSNVSVTP